MITFPPPHHCVWPSGDIPHMTFCGQRALDGKPYCHTHLNISVDKRKPNERKQDHADA